MNNIFHARRFGLLLKKTILERPAQLIGFTVLILSIVLILYFIAKTQIGFFAGQNLAFIWGLAGGGCFLASLVFTHFYSNASGSSYLTLPASATEKWLVGVVVAGVLYPIIFLVFFRLMDAGFVSQYHRSLDPENPLYKMQYDAVYVFSYSGRIAKKVYPIFLLFTPIAMLGSLYFNKAGFIKTALVFCGICFAMFALNWLFAIILFGKIDDAFPFHSVDISVGKVVGSVELTKPWFQIYSFISDYALPVTLWILTYIRLREKEF